MKKHNKVLVFILVTFLLTSLTVRSETAPNLLELTEGISVSGDLEQQDILGTMEFRIDKIWYDSFTDENLVEMTRNMTDTPPYDPLYNVTKQIVTSLIIEDNRTVLVPASRFYTETLDDAVLFFLNITDSMDIAQEDLIVTYHGVNYTFVDIDTGSQLYANISLWYTSWVLGNVLELGLMPLTRYAISPQATIGQEIEYGNYTGEVIAFTEYEISETEKYEAIEVFHEEAIVIVDIFGPQPYTIGASTLLYEKQTGLILQWIEYNSSADLYYYFNATKVVGITPIITEYSVPSLVLLSTILIATPIIMSRKRKK